MYIDPQSIVNAIIGGALIGLSASLLLVINGHVAGISAIMATFLRPAGRELRWRSAFMAGLLAGGIALVIMRPEVIQVAQGRSLYELIGAGVVVGFGVRMGNGCTSGHGVCGISRFSKRSLVATLSFLATGFITATAIHLLQAGAA